MAPNPRQHYLPAAFLARFSSDTDGDLRRRKLFVAQRTPFKIFESIAERVGFVRGLYDAELDEVWKAYEERLPAALDAICNDRDADIDGDTWLRVLVPFVTALLLRGPDFESRFADRFVAEALKERARQGPDARPFELQRLLAPITAARWVVMHTRGETPLLTSDIGWAPYRDPVAREVGLAIPLDVKTLLGVVPRRNNTVLRWKNSGWVTAVEHRMLSC